MSLQIPSGLITGVSGGGVTSGTTLPVITYPQPVVIVGAASGIGSGFHLITDLSGALNVNFSGLAVSVSGDIVLVVSGGAIQVSGTIGIQSGQAALSGVNVVISGGAGNPNISGGVTVSGGITVSGQVNVTSGTVAVAGSGYQLIGWTSGADGKQALNVFIASGSAVGAGGGGGGAVSGFVSISGVALIGMLTQTGGVEAWYELEQFRGAVEGQAGKASGAGVVGIAVKGTGGIPAYWILANSSAVSGLDAANSRMLPVAPTVHDIVSGGIPYPIKNSVNQGAAMQVANSGFSHIVAASFGYTYSNFTGAAITNVQSGRSLLHAVNINTWVSGGQVQVRDSLSGNAGAAVATIDFSEATAGAQPPNTMLYDAIMLSGIVIVTSGAGMDVTVTYKNPA